MKEKDFFSNTEKLFINKTCILKSFQEDSMAFKICPLSQKLIKIHENTHIASSV